MHNYENTRLMNKIVDILKTVRGIGTSCIVMSQTYTGQAMVTVRDNCNIYVWHIRAEPYALVVLEAQDWVVLHKHVCCEGGLTRATASM